MGVCAVTTTVLGTNLALLSFFQGRGDKGAVSAAEVGAEKGAEKGAERGAQKGAESGVDRAGGGGGGSGGGGGGLMEAGAGGAAWARLRAPPPAFAAALAAALLLSCTSPHAFLAATDLAGPTHPCEKYSTYCKACVAGPHSCGTSGWLAEAG